jgi:PAS domain S-box-containing protein
MNISIPTLIMIALGFGFLGSAILLTLRTLSMLRSTRYLKDWYILLGLMGFFLIGYLVAFIITFADRTDILAILTGVIFAFGGFFVYYVARTGQLSIRELIDTRFSKKYIQNIYESIPDALAALDASGKIQSANPVLLRLTGYSESELIGKFFYQVIKIDGQAPEIAIRPLKNIEGTLRARNGMLVPVSFSISTVSEANAGASFVCLIKDITERKRMEEALRLSEERYALASHGANYGVWDWDLRRDQVYFSPLWIAILGLDASETGNSPAEWLNRVHPEDKEELDRKLKQYLEGALPNFEIVHRLKMKDGKYRWFLANGVTTRDGAGKPSRIVGTLHEISDSKQVKEKNAELPH